eukprot:4531229-Pyramimonas_sp.AAC.1
MLVIVDGTLVISEMVARFHSAAAASSLPLCPPRCRRCTMRCTVPMAICATSGSACAMVRSAAAYSPAPAPLDECDARPMSSQRAPAALAPIMFIT